jgi:hypothetical protein
MKKYNLLHGSVNLNTTSAGILKIRLVFGPKRSAKNKGFFNHKKYFSTMSTTNVQTSAMMPAELSFPY